MSYLDQVTKYLASNDPLNLPDISSDYRTAMEQMFDDLGSISAGLSRLSVETASYSAQIISDMKAVNDQFNVVMMRLCDILELALSKDKDDDEVNDDFGFKTMLLLAIATSIDALAVGVTFALEGTDIALAAGLIGLTTFTLSPIGLLVGNRFGLRYKSKAELVGGLVLIGNLIRDQLLKVRDWNVGSAMSMILIALSAGIYLLYRKVGGDDLGVM